MFKEVNVCSVLKINIIGTGTGTAYYDYKQNKNNAIGNRTQIIIAVSQMVFYSVTKRNGAEKQGNHVPPLSQTAGAAPPIDFTSGFLPNPYFNNFDSFLIYYRCLLSCFNSEQSRIY